ncbi:T-complex protein 1 subunit theta [Condylostylus longicornis]|uniref:T-complex protein 1 subunit theta n=1 Tax=Condylostylus longicornis TaxID=2530218 RepID=UPI00244DB8EC|nr:T-complex protein 1 subunit theta [Condylostylus longicornis]
MALSVPRAPGLPQMMKEGARMYSGLEEAVYRNITACKEFSQTVLSAYGPNGMNKMVINHIEKQFVTSDAGTIMRELDVEHPAAKLMVMGSHMQEAEVGDGTNFVVIFAGALLDGAEELLRLGVTASEIAEGYEIALQKAIEILPSLVCHEIKDYRNLEKVEECIRPSVMSKQYGQEDFLANLIANACVSVLPEKSTFNVDNIRVCKILGSGLMESKVLKGMVFKRQVEGDVISAEKAKIAMYSCPVDIIQTETKGTVLIKSADELMNFSRGEEGLLEQQIKSIADTGAKVIVAGGKFGDMALHFMNKYGLMAVRLNSKFDLRRLSKTVGATVLPRLTAPSSEELGYCDNICVQELGETAVISFSNEGADCKISTIVIRGATDNFMDDIERAIDDGVNTFKCLSRDGRFLPGAGAVEIELAQKLSEYADQFPGLAQYSIRKFANALEVFPKCLAENSGINGTEVVHKLHLAHKDGGKNIGVDIEAEQPETIDVTSTKIYDLYALKHWGLKYAVGAAATILKVDQIIMAKRAGGPKARQPAGSDDES